MVGAGGVGCPFCDVDGLRESDRYIERGECVYTSNTVGGEGVLPGSGIIVPRAHRSSPFELTVAEWQSTHELLAEVRSLLDEAFEPDGYNVGWNVGPVAGQEVEHAHLHVIPRFRDELYAGRGIRWWLKQPQNARPSGGAA